MTAPLTRQIHALLAQARAQVADMTIKPPHPLTVAAQKRKERDDE